MNDINKLLSLCKCGIFVTVNEHRDYYQKAEEYLLNQCQDKSDIEEIGEELWKEMIKRDIVISVQFYPDTPVGFYKVYHYDIDEAIKEAIRILEEQK